MKKILNLANEKLALKTKELLNENNIPCTVEGVDIYVSEEEYETSLRKAIEVLESSNLPLNFESDNGQYNFLWIDPYGKAQEFKWPTFFYGKLPKNRRGESSWGYSNRPADFDDFIKMLSQTGIPNMPSWDTSDIVMFYHEDDDVFEFSIMKNRKDFEKIQREIRKQVEEYQKEHPENMPFEKIYWTNAIGKWDKPVPKEKSQSKLYSYLSHSWFLRALKNPDDDCVSYYNQEGNKFGYQTTNYSYQSRNLETHLSLLQPGVREGYDGTFTVASFKTLANYIDSNNKTIKEENPERFTMIDNGTFKSYISYNMEEDQIDVRTIIDLTRSTVGYDFDKKGLRDAIFKNVPQSDYQGRVEVNEHFKPFANGTKLVHFVDDSEFCEIYDLTTKWNPFQGIESLEGTAYPSWKQISPKMDDYEGLMETWNQTQSVSTQGHTKKLKP